MTVLGRQDGDPLVVDLRSQNIDSSTDLWDALSAPCGLPTWFGRNLNAWWDTIQQGGISQVIDNHSFLIVRVSARGVFAGQDHGKGFIEITNQSDYARVRAVVAFLTNDLAAVRARGRLVIIGADVQSRPDAQDGSGPATIRRRAPCAFCRATAAEAWHATGRAVPPLSSRTDVGAERRAVVRYGTWIT